ncbi:hypothetical protein ACHAWO_007882 [Cyclotella atomus]|uniref:Uncharacterized protein n=1 Tax=Cyclotella atomus TaxID=382360 RepID=A0ABD3MZ19_9STRA
MMDAALRVATSLTKFNSSSDARVVAFAHRATRDVFATVNLMLIHKEVAKAIYFGNKRTLTQAKEYALSFAAKLKTVYQNNGEGFAPIEIDHNQTVQANVFQFTAMLSYWYFTLVDTESLTLFRDELCLNPHQGMMYETVARPVAEGSIRLEREKTMEETRAMLLHANERLEWAVKHEMSGKKTSGKKGKKNRG